MFDPSGVLATKDKFEWADETGSYQSCSVMMDGKMIIFGGFVEPFGNQISEVSNCALNRVGTLPMNFQYGGCNVFQDAANNEFAMLCFSFYHDFDCWSYQNGEVKEEPKSKYPHYLTSLGSYQGKPLIVSAGSPRHNKVELFDQGAWKEIDPLTFVDSWYLYSTVTYRGAAYYFGGYSKGLPHSSEITGSYDGKWNVGSRLLRPRIGHRSLLTPDGSSIVHIGGYDSDQPFEFWTYTGGKWTQTASKATLNGYEYYPEAFYVRGDFCY